MRTPSLAYCGTGYRCHSPPSQSPPATTIKEDFGLFVLASITRPSTLTVYLLDRWAGLCLVQYRQQLREAIPGFVAPGVDDLSGHLEGNAAHFVPDVVLHVSRT